MLSEFTASRVPPLATLAVLLQCTYVAACERLLDSSHGADYRRNVVNGAHVVELVEIAAIVILSVGLGLASAGALLSIVFLCFIRLARLRTSAAS
jgi:hypothetical protein